MGVMDMDMDMVTMDIMARGLLRPSLDMAIMVMDMVLDMVMDMAMVTMDIMARDLLMLSLLLLLMPSLLLPLSLDMDMVMDMAMDMDTATMDIMERDLLSQDMDIMAMDMVMDTMDMVMAMAMDIMAKHICCSFLEFSTHKVDPYRSSKKTHNFHLMEIYIEKRKK